MKTLRLLSTTAAVLLLGAGAVSGQGKNDEAPARAPAAQQNAPAEKVAPAVKPGEQKAGTKKAPDTIGQAPKASDSGKSQTMDKPAGEQNRATTGQGAAAGSARLTTEQRTKITTIIKQNKVEPARLNVTVAVGTRVPDSVHFYPLPVEVFVIYPEWRGYNYILVGDQILVIDPRTHQIVAILDA